jgi:hypothetical protein
VVLNLGHGHYLEIYQENYLGGPKASAKIVIGFVLSRYPCTVLLEGAADEWGEQREAWALDALDALGSKG